MKYRIEKDSIGYIKISNKAPWGTQTQRSIKYFNISKEILPFEFINILLIIKKFCVKINFNLNLIKKKKKNAIINIIKDIIIKKKKKYFPLSVWQTGSGTQTNMNINEVIANKASLKINEKIHPNDDINKGQSSNDIFPTAMNILILKKIYSNLLPRIDALISNLKKKSLEFKYIIKIGRTHLQDAIPLTLGQEFSAYMDQLIKSKFFINYSLNSINELALGGTAVGNGFNTHKKFSKYVIKKLSLYFNLPFKNNNNKFSSLSNHENLVFIHGTLKTLASALIKIANDIRLMSSGPKSGLREIFIPENEPGSSIMPGKINPTQCEAIIMLCFQIFGNDTTINISGSSGNFELNVSKPVIIYNFIQSINLLSDGINNFRKFCIKGIKANIKNISLILNKSLILATALTPYLGYDKVAKIIKLAYKKNISIKKSIIKNKNLNKKKLFKLINPKNMIKIF